MIDSHCHLADDAFVDDVGAVVDRATSAGLTRALCILDLTNDAEMDRVPGLMAAWPAVQFATGVHPHKAATFSDRVDDVQGAVRDAMTRVGTFLAVGEIGLDYHYDFAPRELQRAVFAAQIALARELRCPVVVHTREADADTLDILRRVGQGEVRGVFHCFTGDTTMARRALDLGFHVSFSGIVTFGNATDLRAAAAIVPADRLLMETDCPYLAPVPHRGKRNEPAWVSHVADTLAGTRREEPETIVQQTTAAFETLFG